MEVPRTSTSTGLGAIGLLPQVRQQLPVGRFACVRVQESCGALRPAPGVVVVVLVGGGVCACVCVCVGGGSTFIFRLVVQVRE